jgi:hypothetical protein
MCLKSVRGTYNIYVGYEVTKKNHLPLNPLTRTCGAMDVDHGDAPTG